MYPTYTLHLKCSPTAALQDEDQEEDQTTTTSGFSDQFSLDSETQVPISRTVSLDFNQAFSKFIVPESETKNFPEMRLQPLAHRIFEADLQKYFDRFLPYILREIAEDVKSSRENINPTRGSGEGKLPFEMTFLREKDEGSSKLAVYECEAKKEDLPNLEHGFAFEAMHIKLPLTPQYSNNNYDKSFPVMSATVPKKREHRDNMAKKPLEKLILCHGKVVYQTSNIVKLELTILRSELESVVRPSKNTLLPAWHVCGLIPASRLYRFCSSTHAYVSPDFHSQIALGQLEDWDTTLSDERKQMLMDSFSNTNSPEAVSILSRVVKQCVVGLNEGQKDVIFSLVQENNYLWRGLRLLQGPPGTGKSTTVVALLAILAASFVPPPAASMMTLPTEGVTDFDVHVKLCNTTMNTCTNSTTTTTTTQGECILVCAPSNQAVMALVKNCLKQRLHCGVAIASLSVCPIEGSPDERDVCVYDFIKTEQLYNCLKKINHQNPTKKSKQELCDWLQSIQIRSEALLKEKKITSGIEKLTTKIKIGQDSEISALMERWNSVSPGTTSSEEIQKLIHCTKVKVELYVEDVQKFLLQRAVIVFCTLSSSVKKILNGIRFSTVVVDEAGQAVIPEVYMPLSHCPTRMLFVGDHKQLPPTIKCHEATRNGYEKSAMEVLIHELNQPFRVLTWQYRMHPDICRWPSKQYYNGDLMPAQEVITRPCLHVDYPKLPAGLCRAAAIIDVEQGSEERDSGGVSKIREAAEVAETVHKLVRAGVDPNKIGVITFYKNQKEEIRRKLLGNKNVAVNTVDGFQGGEKDFILISIVRTDRIGFLTDARRINVAITRARRSCMLFCNHSAICGDRAKSTFAGKDIQLLLKESDYQR